MGGLGVVLPQGTINSLNCSPTREQYLKQIEQERKRRGMKSFTSLQRQKSAARQHPRSEQQRPQEQRCTTSPKRGQVHSKRKTQTGNGKQETDGTSHECSSSTTATIMRDVFSYRRQQPTATIPEYYAANDATRTDQHPRDDQQPTDATDEANGTGTARNDQ